MGGRFLLQEARLPEQWFLQNVQHDSQEHTEQGSSLMCATRETVSNTVWYLNPCISLSLQQRTFL